MRYITKNGFPDPLFWSGCCGMLIELRAVIEKEAECMIPVKLIPGFFLLVHPHITHIKTQVGTKLFPDADKKPVLIKRIEDNLFSGLQADFIGHSQRGKFFILKYRNREAKQVTEVDRNRHHSPFSVASVVHCGGAVEY